MRVAGRDVSQEILARIRLRVEGDPALTRTALSREVCTWLGWQGADGQPKDMSCRVALLKLARRGVIELPAGKVVSFAKRTEDAVSASQDWLVIETKLAELGRVWLIPVDSGQAELSKTGGGGREGAPPLGGGTGV